MGHYCHPTLSSTPFSLMSVRSSRGILTWKPMALFVLMMILGAEAQTFQYSRGWTNGKRNGGTIYGGGQGAIIPVDVVETGLMSDSLDGIIPPGHLQMNLGPQGRFRTLDYSQYLAKRIVGSGANGGGKQPLWFGTILGVDGADSSATGSSSTNSISNNSPSSSRSRTSTADF